MSRRNASLKAKAHTHGIEESRTNPASSWNHLAFASLFKRQLRKPKDVSALLRQQMNNARIP